MNERLSLSLSLSFSLLQSCDLTDDNRVHGVEGALLSSIYYFTLLSIPVVVPWT